MSRRTLVIVGLIALLLAGVAIGAVWDWFNWHPMDAAVLTLVAIVVLVVGGILALVRPRGSRVAGFVVLALGAGMVVGQLAGPSRPELLASEGNLTIAVDPSAASRDTGVAFCMWSPAGDELQVSGDSNLRLDVLAPIPNAPPDVDQRAFVGISVTAGDRWRDRVVARRDNRDLFIYINGVTEETAEVELAAADASTFDLDWTPEGGSLRFGGLVDARSGGPPPAQLAGLAGTITWTCGPG